MDEAAENAAGDALYEVVRKCAYDIFGKYRPHAEPADDVAMGKAQGSYAFDLRELKDYSREVIEAVNEELSSAFVLARPVVTTWTYRKTVHQIWDNCRVQMTAGARVFESLVP